MFFATSSKLGTMNRSIFFSVLFLALCLVAPLSVTHADPLADQNVVGLLNDLQKSDAATTEALQQVITNETDRLVDEIHGGTVTEAAKENAQAATTMPDFDMQEALAARMGAMPAVEGFARDIMMTRTKQSNGVPLGNASLAFGQLVDTAVNTNTVTSQQFSRYIRYFCDPRSRMGEIATMEFGRGDDKFSCGSDESNVPESSRAKFAVPAGTNATEQAAQENEVINLPVSPSRLFLEATTYPIAAADLGYKATNLNMYAKLWWPAIMQSIEFLVGPPPTRMNTGDLKGANGQREYIARQARATRQSMAAYVFAQLAGERIQSMGPDMAQRMASMLEEYIGNNDPNIEERIADFRRKPGLSLAEYMHIMMYEIPLSQGFIAKINAPGTTMQELQTKKIELAGLQLAVNYQRNRYMELLMALEASRGE